MKLDLFSSSFAPVRTNRYELRIAPTYFFTADDNAAIRLLSDRIDSVQFPSFTNETIQTARYGLGSQSTYSINERYGPLTCTILADEQRVVHDFFYRWRVRIFRSRLDRPTPYVTGYKDDYATNLSVLVYNEAGNKILQYNFEEAFPTAVTEPALSWGEFNTLYRFTVSFEFTYCYME